MSGKAIIVCGATGTGKTTFNKKLLSSANKNSIFLYDVNNEYPEFTTPDYQLPEFDDFSARALLLKNAVIVFEEATIFLDNKGSDRELVELLIKKRHKNNTIILVFHSLTDVPKYIYRKCTHLVLFYTSDTPTQVKNQFGDKVLSIYNRVQSEQVKNKHFHFNFSIY